MKKLIEKFEGLFPHADKVLHFIGGMLIAFIVLILTKATWFGFAAAFVIGLIKEFTDNRKQESVDKQYVISSYLDWFSTIGGALFIELLFHIF